MFPASTQVSQSQINLSKMYAATSVKRPKVTRDAARSTENAEIFQNIGRIEYKPDSSFTHEDQLTYRYYNATERIHGRPMEDWLRAAFLFTNQMSCFTQTSSLQKAYEHVDRSSSMETCRKNIRAMFELCIKLGMKLWSGYEDDLVPEGENLEETQTNYEQICDLINEYQQKTGVKALWIGVNFKHSRYNNGAATNSDANIVAYAGYQTKRALDMAYKLNADCFVINGSREMYDNAMNADLNKEIKHYARFLKLLVEYRDKIGFRGQLLFESNNFKTNTDNCKVMNCNYTNNVFESMLFLKHFNFDRYFKVNVLPGNEFHIANAYGCLGCIDVKIQESPEYANIANITLLLRTIIEKGGLGQLGITFRMPIFNHTYAEPREVMENFINVLDSYGKALRFAVKLVNDATINKYVQTRYASFQTGWGMKFMTCDASLPECEEQTKRVHDANAQCNSNRANHWYVVLQRYVDSSQNLK